MRQAALRGEPLSASELFDAVIRRDKTFGDLLYEIKAAYESFLLDYEVALPINPLPASMPEAPSLPWTPVAASSAPGDMFSGFDEFGDEIEDQRHSEVAVDAIRRPWLGLMDEFPPDEAQQRKACQLERENDALKSLLERLQGEIDELGEEECEEGA